jgi:hypothetical protein
MPVQLDQAVVPRRLQLSIRSLVLSCVCFLATCFGASAITISMSLILSAHAGSVAYWSTTGVLLVLWFATLISMYRFTLAAIVADRWRPASSHHFTRR